MTSVETSALAHFHTQVVGYRTHDTQLLDIYFTAFIRQSVSQ